MEKFGEQTLEMIDQFSARLREVDGIGPERAEADQGSVDPAEERARHHDLPAGPRHRQRACGQDLQAIWRERNCRVRENPYRLAKRHFRDRVPYGGWHRGEAGDREGFGPSAESGSGHALERATDEGHTCVPHGQLVESTGELLNFGAATEPSGGTGLSRSTMADKSAIENAIQLLSLEGDVVTEEGFVYLAGLCQCERGVAAKIKEICAAPLGLPSIQMDKAIAWIQSQPFGIELAEAQQQAVRTALTAKVCVITGGPGVGKTTIVNSVVRILQAKNSEVLLAAPTGRAAKRMTESLMAGGEKPGRAAGTFQALQAQTIHRLLKYDPREGGFTHHERRPLRCDLLVVDETSMLDITLAYHLLKAVPKAASVVFVGDVDQLPSVGPGNFLRDLIESGSVPVVRLTQIYRQTQNSAIVVNAHRVNEGQIRCLVGRDRRARRWQFPTSGRPGGRPYHGERTRFLFHRGGKSGEGVVDDPGAVLGAGSEAIRV